MKEKLFYNCNIVTVDEGRPYANYIVTCGEKIEAIGTSCETELFKQYAHTEKINLKGKFVVPGLIDSHLHMLTGALTKLQVDMNGIVFENAQEAMDYIDRKSHVREGWIRAFGFDEANLGEKRLLTREDLDEGFPDRPVIITRVCGHLSMLNSTALELLGEGVGKNITGGEFQKDKNGKLTGIVTEAAQQYVLDNIPSPKAAEVLPLLEREQEMLLEKGICSIHDAGTDQLTVKEYVDIYMEFNKSNRLKLRTNLMVRPMKEMGLEAFIDYVKELRSVYTVENSKLFFQAVKLFADGSIGGKTAAVYEDYEGSPGNKGLLLEEDLCRYIAPLHRAGLQVAVHAIGDRAAEFVADLMIDAMNSDKIHIRHRIEHAELARESLIEKIKKNQLSIMTQPGFIGEFQESYRRNLGEENAARIQPIKTMLGQGINLGFGSDYPVIDADPLYGIDCAVNRRQKKGSKVLNAEERIRFNEALKCYTLENAYVAYAEHLQGSLAVGKFADFVVLDYVSEEMIPEMTGMAVEKTVIGGEILYEKTN